MRTYLILHLYAHFSRHKVKSLVFSEVIKPIFRSNLISAHNLLSQPFQNFCTFIHKFLSTIFLPLSPPRPLFSLLCFLCRCFVVVIFIMNISETHIADVLDATRAYVCVDKHTHHVAFRCIGPHVVCVDVSRIGFLYGPQCARDGVEKMMGALKNTFYHEKWLESNVKVVKCKPFHFSGCFIHWSTGKGLNGVNQKVYIVIFFFNNKKDI